MNENDDFQSGSPIQSEFNGAVSYLNRLNMIFTLCDEASIDLNIVQWFHLQQILYRELSTFMKPEQMTEVDKKIEELNPLICDLTDEISKGNNETPVNLYQKLHKMELYLRTIYKESGLQMKMLEDARKALK